MTFDSMKELKRYQELELLQRAGEIKNLQRQSPFTIIHKSKYGRAIKYVADFCYYDKKGSLHVEDVKSPYTAKNPVYRLKKRLMQEVNGITIEEV